MSKDGFCVDDIVSIFVWFVNKCCNIVCDELKLQRKKLELFEFFSVINVCGIVVLVGIVDFMIIILECKK